MGRMSAVRLCSLCILFMVSVGVDSTALGDKVSSLITTFANDGLGVAEMQNYVSTEVTFVTEEISASTVAQIANDMSDKLQRRLVILRELQVAIADSYNNDTSDLTMEDYQTCCKIELEEDNSFLNAKVNLENWCLLGDTLASETPPQEMLPRHIMERFRSKYNEEDGLKYIYFGSEDGVLYNFPGIKYCGSYDPRFRPWYVQTATPEHKDVVIVIDRSGSMNSAISSGGKTLMEVAIDAAITVVNTLNPNDRVGIVTFSTNAETPPGTDDPCFSTSLAKANPQNKEYLRGFISDAFPDGDTHYNRAFSKAFQYFKNTPQEEDGGQRDRVVLFLTDGIPSDDNVPESIYTNLRDLNAELNNEVVVLTYFLSTSSDDVAEEILTNLANQTYHNPSIGDVTKGKFTHVSDPNDLRSEMASFYELFELDEDEAKPTFSAPFLDTFNTSNIQISMCLPVKSLGDIKGVVCIDHSVDDILSDVTYFKKGDLAYAFVIDSQARVLSHPLLTNPVDITADPIFVQLPSLEVTKGIKDVMTSMTRGETGSAVLQSLRVTPRGSLYTEGVNTLRIASTYYWHPVQGTSFSVCVVSSNIDRHDTIKWDQDYPKEFVYHLNRVYQNPYGTCRLFAREALRDLGNVKFGARAFVDPYAYVYGQETSRDLNAYTGYFTGLNNTNPGFRSGVREEVALTYRFEELMESRDEYADYAIWRYIATESGIIRIFPGSEVPVMFDALVRSWYIRSMSVPSVYSISTPYNDALGAGIVVTISKAILTPSGDAAVGVMGMDFTLAYLHELLIQEIQECTKYECIIVEQSGFIVLHSKWLKPEDGQIPVIEGVHLSSQEPEIAHDLVTQKILRDHSCINLEALNEQVFWKLRYIKESFQAPSWYDLHEVPQTNIYVVVKKGPPIQTEQCHCPKTQAVEMCSSEVQTCFCPCFTKTTVYSYCSGIFTLTEDGDPPCSPPIPSIDFSYISRREENIVKGLEICRDYQCDKRNIRSECVGVASCSWCAYNKEDGTLLDEPYCSTWDKCAFGIGPATTTDVDNKDGLKLGALLAAIILPVAAVVTAIVVATIWMLKRYRNKKNVKNSIQRSNTTPNPYFGVQTAEASAQAEQGQNGDYVHNFKLQHSSMPDGLGPDRPKSCIDDPEVYDELRESHLFPPPPDELLVGFKVRPRPDSLPPTPPPEELPDNYNDDFIEVSADNTSAMPFTQYGNSEGNTSVDQERYKDDIDVYLKPKTLTKSPGDPGYTGLGSVANVQSVTKDDDSTSEEQHGQRDSDVYLKARSVPKPEERELKESDDIRDSYRRLVNAYPMVTSDKY